MQNKDVADILTRMGKLLEVQGENPFKIRAYYKAAENIESLGEDIEDVKRENRLSAIAGIGKALEEKITEFLDTGHIGAYDRLTRDVPETLLEVMEIPSVGPKKAKLFFDELKIKSVDDLAAAAQDGRLLKLEGVREKTVEKILEGIAIVRQGRARLTIAAAAEIADSVIQALKRLPEVKGIETGGSLRRRRETIGDIDILVDSPEPKKVMEAFVRLPQVKTVQAYGDTKSSVLTHENVQVDLRVVAPNAFGAALLYFTGSKTFNVRLRQLAMKKNLKVSEYGIFAVKGEKETLVASKTERACFKALGLDYVPPELREEIGEERLWSGEKIPELVELDDIKGELHVHSIWSDGTNTIEQMVQEAKRRGYEYLAVSDHSEKLRVARGLSMEDLNKKIAEIERLNRTQKNFRILCGAEVEIDSDGHLDYNEDTLKRLDIVIAAIHSGFEQSREQLTRRLVKACQNKRVHIIAHPTGSHFGKRPPYDIDFKEVCRAAADTNTFLEINSFPIRLDLDSANTYFARSQGVKFVINTDAHSTTHMDFMKYGIGVARRGWLEAADVVNTRSWKDLKRILKS